MRTELARLQHNLDVTSIYVTHDQEEAMTMGDRVAILNNGELQQVGGPNEVYDRPANRFVAEFIGSPSMNFLDVELRDGSGGYRLVGAGGNGAFDYPLTDETARRLGVEEGTPLGLGVRPEGITVETDPAGDVGERAQRATIGVVEPMGSDSHVYFDLDGTTWTARTDRIEHEPGTEIAYSFEESACTSSDPTVARSNRLGTTRTPSTDRSRSRSRRSEEPRSRSTGGNPTRLANPISDRWFEYRIVDSPSNRSGRPGGRRDYHSLR
jgi:multiple sugar transport system ATP-binding protein